MAVGKALQNCQAQSKHVCRGGHLVQTVPSARKSEPTAYPLSLSLEDAVWTRHGEECVKRERERERESVPAAATAIAFSHSAQGQNRSHDAAAEVQRAMNGPSATPEPEGEIRQIVVWRRADARRIIFGRRTRSRGRALFPAGHIIQTITFLNVPAHLM